jgi:DNA-binding HxlR family transcriptional regulator
MAREAYRLTAKGNSLLPVLNAIVQWGLTNLKGTEARLKAKTRVAQNLQIPGTT